MKTRLIFVFLLAVVFTWGDSPSSSLASHSCTAPWLAMKGTDWEPDSTCSPIIVTEDLVVPPDTELNLGPGTELRFDPGVSLIISGTLVAAGDPGNPVRFTSNQILPAAGDWGSIYFADSSRDAVFSETGSYLGGSLLQNAIIEYGGGLDVSNNGAIRVDAAAPYIVNNLIQKNRADGIHVWNSPGLRIHNNHVANNGMPGVDGAGDFLGNGIWISTSGPCTVTANTVTDNLTVLHADIMGGAVVLDQSTVFFSDNTVTGSHTGLFLHKSNTVVTGNTIRDNVGLGGIRILSGVTEITQNQIRGNVFNQGCSGDGQGGGISICGGPCIYGGGGSATIRGNTIIDNQTLGCRNGGGGIRNSGGYALIEDNWIVNNSAYFSGGGIDSGGAYSGQSIIRRNYILNNHVENGDGGGISLRTTIMPAQPITVSHNIIAGNTASLSGGGISGAGNIEWNQIVYNSAQYSAGVNLVENSVLRGNTILGNQASDSSLPSTILTYQNPVLLLNTIYSNNGYALCNYNPTGASTVLAQSNWWGTRVLAEISGMIYDGADDPEKALVDYSSYLDNPYVDAPISPPTGLITTSESTSIGLSWNTNPEPDVISYRLYWDIDRHVPQPGLPAYAHSLNLGNTTGFTLAGLEPGHRYYLGLTAFDCGINGVNDQIDGYESWFSEVFVDIPPMLEDLPLDEPVTGIVRADDLGYRDYQFPALNNDPLLLLVDPGQVNLMDWKSFSLQDTAVELSVFARLNEVPDWSHYDYMTEDTNEKGYYELTLPPESDGTYYLRIYAREAPPDGVPITILVQQKMHRVYLPMMRK